MMRRALLALAALALVAPGALAHIGAPDQSASLTVGEDYLAFFEPRPSPPFENDTVTFAVKVADRRTGAPLANVPATVIVGGPQGFNARKALADDGTGYLIGAFVLPHAGPYSARLLLRNPETNETSSADAEFEVYRDLPFRIRPVDETQDVYVGHVTALAFEIVDPITLARVDAFEDLDVQVEHWTEDHRSLLSYKFVEPRKMSKGVWRIDERFEEAGMYHVRFASETAGFTYGDVPLLHVYADTPPPSDAQTPLPGAAAALALLGVLALLLGRR